jgi:hypothetical protein
MRMVAIRRQKRERPRMVDTEERLSLSDVESSTTIIVAVPGIEIG